MEDTNDPDYKHANNVFRKFNLNNLGDYHDLYVKSDTLLLAEACKLPEKMVVNNTKKLICNLQDKKDYVVHINVLKQALDNCLELIKVHQVIELDQEAWLKEYINFNTELRKKASNEFEKDFFELRNNAVFGKTIENVRKHCDIKLVKTDKKGIS